VKAVVLLGAVALLLLDLVASARVLRSDLAVSQKVAWLLLVWLLPLVGAVFAFQISTESGVPGPKAGSAESGSQVWPPGIGESHGGSSDGHSA
jgi:hypothetical protein